jgi:hypothetical protein
MSDLWKIIIGTSVGATVFGWIGELVKDIVKDYFGHKREIIKLKREKIVEYDIKVNEILYNKLDELYNSMGPSSDQDFSNRIIVLEEYLVL